MAQGDAVNEGMSMANGLQQPAPSGMDTPIAVYQPVTITPNTIKWLATAIASVMIFLAGSPVFERWVNPAKQSDLEGLSAVVRILSKGQDDIKAIQENSNRAMERLTLAVDNLSGVVDSLKKEHSQITEDYIPSTIKKRLKKTKD
jgi:hypothetical protein